MELSASSTWLGSVGVREHCPSPSSPAARWLLLCHGRRDGACIREASRDPAVEEGLLLGLWGAGFREGEPHRCHWCQASGASRKQFSHPVQFPKVWEAMMVCKRRVLQFYSVWYLLVVSCAADRSPFSTTRAPCSLSLYSRGSSMDCPGTCSLQVPSGWPLWLEATAAAPLRNCPKGYTFIF